MTKPLVEYNTPGVECQHADKGCCPSCRPSVRPRRGYMHSPFKDNVSFIRVGKGDLGVTGRRLLFNLTGASA